MIRNMGTTDRIVRVVVGVAATLGSVLFGWGSLLETIVGAGLLVVAGIMFVTAAIAYCPTYRLIHVSTYPHFHRTAKSEPLAALRR